MHVKKFSIAANPAIDWTLIWDSLVARDARPYSYSLSQGIVRQCVYSNQSWIAQMQIGPEFFIIFMCQSLRYLKKYIEVRNILKYVSGIKVLRPVHVRYNWFLSIFLRESNVTNIILYKYCVNLCSHHCDRLCSESPAIVLSELTLFFPSKHQTLQWTSL